MHRKMRKTFDTQFFCWLQYKTDMVVFKLFDTRIGDALGLLLIFCHHFIMFMKAAAEYGSQHDASIFHGLFEVLRRDSPWDDAARLSRLLGQNVMVFSCYYGAHQMVLSDWPFIHGLLLIVGDQLVVWGVRKLIEKCLFGQVAKTEGAKMYDIKTVYALPSASTLQCCLYWISQTVLFFLYFLVMNQIKTSIKQDCQTLVWLFGVIVMCTVGERQAGESFDFDAWTIMWQEWRNKRAADAT